MNRTRLLSVLATLVLGASWVPAAHAQERSEPLRGHVQLDTFFFGGDASRSLGSDNTFSWANLLSGGIDAGEWGGRVWVPFAYGSARVGSSNLDGFMIGNIALEGFYDLQLDRDLQLRLIARLGLPTSSAASDNGTQVAALFAGGVTFWDPRYWPAGVVTPGVAAELSYLDDLFILNGMATADVLIGTRDGGRAAGWSGETHFTSQLMVDFSFRIARIVHAGLRAMTALTWTRLRDNDDAGALAFEPFIATDPALDFPVYGRLGVILNVDNHLGPSFESGRVWAVHLTAGVNLE